MERRRSHQNKFKEQHRLFRSEQNLTVQRDENVDKRFETLRRLEKQLNDALADLLTFSSSKTMMSDNRCAHCHQSITIDEQIVNADGQIWHTQCFV